MENYLSKESLDILDKIVIAIKSSKEYKECINIKKKMSKDIELLKLTNEVKILQQKYIRSNFNKTIKNELDIKNKLLEDNKLFIEYNYYLNIVNKKIDFIKDTLNNYFNDLTSL